MIPEQTLSSTTVLGTYIHGDTEDYSPTTDHEPGGTALNDASDGLFVQLWTATTDGTDVTLSAPSVPAAVLFSRPGTITELSLAFDQNMRPVVAFVEDGQAYLYWYDTLAAAQVFTTLAADVDNPRVTLDDKRERQTGTSDVILAYKRATALYFRAQRDRFLVEYHLASGVNRGLRTIRMNNKLRLQFELGPVVA